MSEKTRNVLKIVKNMNQNETPLKIEDTDFRNYVPPTWDEWFMEMVYLIARKSKDPRTKIGAVLVKNSRIISMGYNGIPSGVRDESSRLERPEKYDWIAHAEANCCYFAAKYGISVENSTVYTQGLPCCSCCISLIQTGVKEVVIHKQWENISTKITNRGTWRDVYKKSDIMFTEAGVTVRYLDKVLQTHGFLDGKRIGV